MSKTIVDDQGKKPGPEFFDMPKTGSDLSNPKVLRKLVRRVFSTPFTTEDVASQIVPQRSKVVYRKRPRLRKTR